MRIRLFILGILALICGSGCNSSSQGVLPTVSGSANEVLVVCDEPLWAGIAGDSIKSVLGTIIEGLPQAEPSFDPVHRTFEGFRGSYNLHRNILIVKIDSAASNDIRVRRDVWAEPQIVLQASAKSREELLQILGTQAQSLLELLVESEKSRYATIYKKLKDQQIAEELASQFNISLDIPGGWVLDARGKGYAWLTSESRRVTQHLLIWEYPYTDELQLSAGMLIAKRNEVGKQYVPGPNKDSFMTTELTYYLPVFREETINNRYFATIRGLWKMENYIMGGPFVQISTVDTQRNRIVTVEGFVFAPSEEKRKYVRQIEAILYSLSFPEESKTPEVTTPTKDAEVVENR